MTELLDFIEANTDPNNLAQVHAREWASRVRQLQERQADLLEKQKALLDAADAAADEFDKVSAELTQLHLRQEEVLSRLRPSTEAMQ